MPNPERVKLGVPDTFHYCRVVIKKPPGFFGCINVINENVKHAVNRGAAEDNFSLFKKILDVFVVFSHYCLFFGRHGCQKIRSFQTEQGKKIHRVTHTSDYGGHRL